MNITEKTALAGEITLNYAECGQASRPALVLLHGGSARWQSWNPILPGLAEQWHVYAPDLRGHGKSGRAQQYRLQDYAADTAAFLSGVVKKPAFLFGYSLGGMVALYTAAQFPEQVNAVIVGDAPLNRDTFRSSIEGSRSQLESWASLAGGQVPVEEIIRRLKDSPIETDCGETTMRTVWGEDHPVYTWLGKNLFDNDPAMLRAILDNIGTVTAGYHMNTLLPQVRCPVMLLQGDPAAGNGMTDIEIARAVQLLNRPRVVRMEGISHIFHNEVPEQVLATVNAFLMQVAGSA